jgi:hypothetical protein
LPPGTYKVGLAPCRAPANNNNSRLDKTRQDKTSLGIAHFFFVAKRGKRGREGKREKREKGKREKRE